MMDRVRRVYRAMVRWIDETSLPALLLIFVVVIVAFGAFYTCMTPSENGVIQSSKGSAEFDFFNGLYFSIVTVSSLGYGDMYPVGWSKIAAVTEVILGLGLIGIMIAKLTSRPLSHLVSRLFVSATRHRLKEFEDRYSMSFESFRVVLNEIADTYQATPGGGQLKAQKDPLKGLFDKAVEELKTACSELIDYIAAETKEGTYFRLVPKTSAINLATSIERAFFELSQCIISLPISSNPKILDDILNIKNRRTIAYSIDLQRTICKEFSQSKKYDNEIVQAFSLVRDVCNQVSGSYYHTPKQDQPDQMLASYELPESI